MSDFNARVIDEFRANEGRVDGQIDGAPLILIHHIGVKSHKERVNPVGCFPRPDGRIAIVASNGGAPTHPDWFHNLIAHPRITVEFGKETFSVAVRELEGAEREQVWAHAAGVHPDLDSFQTTRTIPVLLLTRLPDAYPRSVCSATCASDTRLSIQTRDSPVVTEGGSGRRRRRCRTGARR